MSFKKFTLFFIVAFAIVIGAFIYINNSDIRATALIYHSVSEWYPQGRTDVFMKPSVFENQIAALKKDGFTFITYKDIEEWKLQGKEIPKKSVLLTFDDGYGDNYKIVYPILKKYNAKATIFVVSSFVDTNYRYLTWDQLKEMHDSGVFEVGSHTYNHVPLTELNDKHVESELTLSRDSIKEHLGFTPYVLSYPQGKWNKSISEKAKNAGYTVQANSESISLGGKTLLENCGRINADGSFSGDQIVKLIERSRFTSKFKMLLYPFKY